ncbi:MAG: hypothetical protein ACKOCI_09330, partial [Cyanobium sp.]
MTRLGLIDYGMGNLHSVQRAFERLGASVVPVRGELPACDALILPGVGAGFFGVELAGTDRPVPHGGGDRCAGEVHPGGGDGRIAWLGGEGVHEVHPGGRGIHRQQRTGVGGDQRLPAHVGDRVARPPRQGP